ncbi:MAG: twin-arginine translocase TatA/TatE family subunit [Acidobacteria bacterium]|nr:twin-arginine translocase TatA/TatE family subunit [Acidobacteriota bacterium]
MEAELNLGVTELLIILAIVLLLFGSTRIPQLAKGLGEGIRNFKTSLKSSEKGEDEKDKPKAPEK